MVVLGYRAGVSGPAKEQSLALHGAGGKKK